jgi:hypothetical protein
MIEVRCPCGRIHTALDSAAGKKARCEGCGATLLIPLLAASALLFGPPPGESVTEPADDGPPVELPPEPASPAAFEIPKLVRQPPAPSEPWFYWFLETYAWISMILGVGQLVVTAGVTFARFDPDSFALVALLPLLISLGWLLGIMLVSCLLLVAVDAARHLRAIRADLRASRAA